MSAREQAVLAFGYACIVLAVLAALGIFLTSAATAPVVAFVLGLVGVVSATAALVRIENGADPHGGLR